ncbi:MAG: SDR family oxidoreductase [Myxococcota bacterium]|nr:SDR family oxidoreductase [Myxococcota bacterium]
MSGELAGQVVVVIGGSGGLGRAIALLAAQRGADVALTWRSRRASGEAVAAQITSLGRRTMACAMELTDADSVTDGLATIAAHLGSIDALICAAGPDLPQPSIASVTPQQWQDTVLADLTGVFNLVSAGLPHLRASTGSFVALSSAGVRRHPPGDILSVAPKAAIEALVRGVAREEGRHGVRANAVAVGVIEAGQYLRLRQAEFSEKWEAAAKRNTALKRLGTPDELAEAVLFLASRRAAYVTGQVISVDGGYSL